MKIALLLIMVYFAPLCTAQTQKGNVGVSAEIQSEQLDFLIPIFVKKNVSFSPAFGVRSISERYTDLSAGLIIRYYFSDKVVSPFLGARVGAMILTPKDGDSSTDLIYGPLFGGEYYFTEKFSIGVELQLNVLNSGPNSNRFGNPGGTDIHTATAFFATIYF